MFTRPLRLGALRLLAAQATQAVVETTRDSVETDPFRLADRLDQAARVADGREALVRQVAPPAAADRAVLTRLVAPAVRHFRSQPVLVGDASALTSS